MKKISLLIALIFIIISCSDNDDTTPENIVVSILFSQNWDGEDLSQEDFGTTNFTNAHGEVMTLLKLRYLISKITLHQSNGDSFEIEGYKLIDLTDQNTFSF